MADNGGLRAFDIDLIFQLTQRVRQRGAAMSTLRSVVGAIAALAALFSGTCWVLSSRAKILAATQNPGVGFGGTPVNVLNEKGEVIDFLATYAIQSKWNSRAAFGSAIAAFAAAILFVLST
jgi:hypothetical protein